MSKSRNGVLSDKERARLAHILLSQFEREHREAHGRKPSINRYSAKWGMMDVIDSVDFDRASELITYYMGIRNTTFRNEHPLEFFYKNFDKMDANEIIGRRDAERRAMIMRNTAERIKEAENQ